MPDSEDLTYENESYLERHSCNNCSRLVEDNSNLITLIRHLKKDKSKLKLEIKQLTADAKDLINYL